MLLLYSLLNEQLVDATVSFDLVSSGDRHPCLSEDLATCHIKVYNRPWQIHMFVLWERSTCKSLKPDETTPGCLTCPMPAKVDQKIVNFALAELSWGDCHMKQSLVENFKSYVISDSPVFMVLVLIFTV